MLLFNYFAIFCSILLCFVSFECSFRYLCGILSVKIYVFYNFIWF